MTTELKAGEAAPDFNLPGDAGPVSLAMLKGKAVVLYFYPKDDTSGCTAEAQGFTTAADDFAAGRDELACGLGDSFALLLQVVLNKLLVVAAGDEADLLRIGLVG